MSIKLNQQIGLFGFGVVGQGLYEVLQSTPGLTASIKKVCIKNMHKPRSADLHFTANARELLDDPSINVIVELIDDADAAFKIVKAALQKGKAVVTANKKMVATHFSELYDLQQEYRTPLLYEAACCASIPIIRNLEEYYDNDMLQCIRGIVNGSTNYILSYMENNLSFPAALLQAQQLGFAESNPSLDVEGHDALNKLIILITHSFGTIPPRETILFNGINAITQQDIQFASEKGYRIKLIAQAKKLTNGKLAAYVFPTLVPGSDELYHVRNEYNGLITESAFADRHFFKGKGAGAVPTAAAVLSDLSALRYQYKYEYRKVSQRSHFPLSDSHYFRVTVTAADAVIREEDFAWIDERHSAGSFSRITGTIGADRLLHNNWWKQPGISMILCEQSLTENITDRLIRKKSLELAGVNL